MESSIARILTDLITEVHNIAITELRGNCNEYRCAIDRLDALEDNLKTVLTDEQKRWLQKYRMLSRNIAHFEQRYMYIQGLKDYPEMINYIDSECLDKYLLTAEIEVE